jgi:hypothetical protein
VGLLQTGAESVSINVTNCLFRGNVAVVAQLGTPSFSLYVSKQPVQYPLRKANIRCSFSANLSHIQINGVAMKITPDTNGKVLLTGVVVENNHGETTGNSLGVRVVRSEREGFPV